MTLPTINEKIAITNTAPALISLILPIVSCFCGWIKSHNFSIDVFINSNPITSTIQTNTMKNSSKLSLKKKPDTMTKNETIKWNLKFHSDFKAK